MLALAMGDRVVARLAQGVGDSRVAYSPPTAASGWRAVSVAPALATTTSPTASHCPSVRRSCRKSQPQSAAAAGSMLIKMLKVRVGKRLSACISRVKGSALDSSASAAPAASRPG
jgi:predicted Zn-dependent protease